MSFALRRWCISYKLSYITIEVELQTHPKKLSTDVKCKWDNILSNARHLELFHVFCSMGNIRVCNQIFAKTCLACGSLLPMEGHSHIITHTRACMDNCRLTLKYIQKTQSRKVMNPACISHTHTFANILTEGVRAICGPSHASPMQRCLLEVGVIIGHAGLFLCQRRPCQENTDNRAQWWLAYTATAHVDGFMCTYINPPTHPTHPAFLLMTCNLFTFHSTETVKRIEYAAHLEIKPQFSDVISSTFFVPLSSCKMKILINVISIEGNWWFLWSQQRES